MAQKRDIVISQGASFAMEVRWAINTPIFKAISGVTKAAPPVVTCTAHGLPDGWPISVLDVVGMEQINNPGGQYTADVIDANSFSVRGISSLRFQEYLSGGVIVYLEPMSLASAVARMKIKLSKASAAVLVSLDSLVLGGIGLNDTDKTIIVELTPSQTAVLSFKKAFYDLEILLPSLEVERLLEGEVTLSEEVTD